MKVKTFSLRPFRNRVQFDALLTLNLGTYLGIIEVDDAIEGHGGLGGDVGLVVVDQVLGVVMVAQLVGPQARADQLPDTLKSHMQLC